jgi:hypothetical protein
MYWEKNLAAFSLGATLGLAPFVPGYPKKKLAFRQATQK